MICICTRNEIEEKFKTGIILNQKIAKNIVLIVQALLSKISADNNQNQLKTRK